MPLNQSSLETATTELTPSTTEELDPNSPIVIAETTTEFSAPNTTEIFADNASSIDTSPNPGTRIANEIDNATEAFTTVSSSDETGLNDLDAILAGNPYVTTRNERNIAFLQNPEHFPNIVKSILNNKNTGKWTIHQFADQMVTHQCHYGLSDNLLESLDKVGKIFEAHYHQQPNKQILIDKYFNYIANQKNVSDIPVFCLRNTTNVETVTTTTLPTTQIPQTDEPTFATEYFNVTEITSPAPLPTSSAMTTTDLMPQQPTTATTPGNVFNSTLIPTTTLATHNHSLDNLDNVYDTSSTRVLDPHQLLKSGLVSAGQGALAGSVNGVIGSIYNILESKGYFKGWRKPLVQTGMSLVNATVIAALPVLLSTVKQDEESKQSDFADVLSATAYSFASSIALSGISYAAQSTYTWFNGKPMNESYRQALATLPLLANGSQLINHGYNLTQASVIVGSNILTAGLSSAITQTAVNRIFYKPKKIKNDIESGNENNNIEMLTQNNWFENDDFDLDSGFRRLAIDNFQSKDSANLTAWLADKNENKSAFFFKNLLLLATQHPEVAQQTYNDLTQRNLLVNEGNLTLRCNIIPFTLKNEDKESPENTIKLKKLLGSYIYGLKLNSDEFKFESKAIAPLTEHPSYHLERINIAYGAAQSVLSILIPKGPNDLINFTLLLQTIDNFAGKLTTHNPNNKIYSKLLFIVPNETLSIIELETHPQATSLPNVLTVYNPTVALDLKTLRNIAKQYQYNYKIEKNHLKETDPLTSYYFIKNLVKNYLQDCLLPDNSTPNLLEGLLATFIHKLESDFKFEVEKIKPEYEPLSSSRKSTFPKNAELNQEDIELRNGHLVNTIERKRSNALACGVTTGNLTIFNPVQYKNDKDILNLIQRCLDQQKAETQTHPIKKIIFPLANEKGIAIIEINTANDTASASTFIIHDPNQILKSNHNKIQAIVKNHYKYQLNPNNNYTSDWQSPTHCQLAVYYFLKELLLNYLKPNNFITPSLDNAKTAMPRIILDEIQSNLNLTNDQAIGRFSIKRCDGGVFSLNDFIAMASHYLRIVNIPTLAPTNTSNLKLSIASEIRNNLGLTHLLNDQEIDTWNQVSFANWSELLCSKETILFESEFEKNHYLIKFPSDFFLIKGKVAILNPHENTANPLLSEIRNFLTYKINGNKKFKKEFSLNDLRELFSKFLSTQNNTQETKVYQTRHVSFFNVSELKVVPNLSTTAPVQQSHSTPRCN